MRSLFLVIALMVPLMGFGWQQAAPAQPTAPARPATPAQVQGAVRITSPKAGEKLVDNFVEVQYEVVSQVSAADSPTFRVRLDGQPPITTTDLSHTFTGLTAGPHTVTVELVDANGTPIMGSLAQTRFSVVTGQTQPNHLPHASSMLKNAGQYRQVGFRTAGGRSELPESGSPLPLLSVIGLGVLIGGLASALKVTRT